MLRSGGGSLNETHPNSDFPRRSRHGQAGSGPGYLEFLQLSLERQAAYVDGILQGMSYVMANYDKAGSERWNACLRSQSVEATVGEVLQVLKDDPAGSSEPVPWAVMRVVNQRC